MKNAFKGINTYIIIVYTAKMQFFKFWVFYCILCDIFFEFELLLAVEFVYSWNNSLRSKKKLILGIKIIIINNCKQYVTSLAINMYIELHTLQG